MCKIKAFKLSLHPWPFHYRSVILFVLDNWQLTQRQWWVMSRCGQFLRGVIINQTNKRSGVDLRCVACIWKILLWRDNMRSKELSVQVKQAILKLWSWQILQYWEWQNLHFGTSWETKEALMNSAIPKDLDINGSQQWWIIAESFPRETPWKQPASEQHSPGRYPSLPNKQQPKAAAVKAWQCIKKEETQHQSSRLQAVITSKVFSTKY